LSQIDSAQIDLAHENVIDFQKLIERIEKIEKKIDGLEKVANN